MAAWSSCACGHVPEACAEHVVILAGFGDVLGVAANRPGVRGKLLGVIAVGLSRWVLHRT